MSNAAFLCSSHLSNYVAPSVATNQKKPNDSRRNDILHLFRVEFMRWKKIDAQKPRFYSCLFAFLYVLVSFSPCIQWNVLWRDSMKFNYILSLGIFSWAFALIVIGCQIFTGSQKIEFINKVLRFGWMNPEQMEKMQTHKNIHLCSAWKHTAANKTMCEEAQTMSIK